MRPLPVQLENILAAGTPQPAFKLLAYDPGVDSISAIVRGEATQTPFDLTPYCGEISWAPAQMSFPLVDPGALFHPDTGSARAFLVDKAVVRLLEGDARVAEAFWMWSFTGQVQGQIGWQKSRRSRKMEGQVTVMARENLAAFRKRSITTKSYTLGTDVGVMLGDVCEQFLGFTATERRLPQVMGLQLLHNVNQLSQVPPWDAVSALLETVNRTPYCDGEGKLTALNQDLHRPTDRVLPDYVKIVDLTVPARNQDFNNRIEVTFLDAQMTLVEGQPQKLGSVTGTLGFFSGLEQVRCYWSEDRRQRAHYTRMVSVGRDIDTNGLGLPVGSVEYEEVDEFSGVFIITPAQWVDVAILALLVDYVASTMLLPDKVVVSGLGVSGGITIPVGRLVQAIDLVAILMIMMSLGSYEYEVWGTPYDYAYLEKRAMAIQDGLQPWEEVPRQIKNDFLGSMPQARAVAMSQLAWEESNACPRQLVIGNDLALEKGDIVQLPDGYKLLATDLAKTIKRGETPIMTLQGFKVRTA